MSDPLLAIARFMNRLERAAFDGALGGECPLCGCRLGRPHLAWILVCLNCDHRWRVDWPELRLAYAAERAARLKALRVPRPHERRASYRNLTK